MAKVMAYVEDGVVTNIVSYNEDEPETGNLKDIFDRPVYIGDSYSDGRFYRDRKEIKTQEETSRDMWGGMNVTQEPDRSATRNHEKGSFLVIGSQLYEVVRPISKGESIVAMQNAVPITSREYYEKISSEE